jgi:hypothetical protein
MFSTWAQVVADKLHIEKHVLFVSPVHFLAHALPRKQPSGMSYDALRKSTLVHRFMYLHEKCINCVLSWQLERLAHEGRLPITSREARDTVISDIPGLPSAHLSSGFPRLFLKPCHVQQDEIPSLPARKSECDPRQNLLRTRKATH